jgi:hypothetical protein
VINFHCHVRTYACFCLLLKWYYASNLENKIRAVSLCNMTQINTERQSAILCSNGKKTMFINLTSVMCCLLLPLPEEISSDSSWWK